MNTLEILYQAFRVRYSLNQLQQLLDRGCRIALLGPDDAVSTLKGFFGDPVPPMGGGDPSEDLIALSWDLTESDIKELRTCDACLVLFPEGAPEIETLQELAGKIPIHVKTMWLCLVDQAKGGTFHEKDLTLPTVQALPRAKARARFLKLLMLALPQVVVILARHWTGVRAHFCKTLTRRTALRNGIRAGVSSLPLRAVPVIGPVLAMLATSAETMMLTSSQLRLSFVIAAAHNRPLDFFDRISELWPIIGSAFGFRGVSRTLVRMLPNFGPGLKASIAFSGTFAIGEACRLYYEQGQPTSDEVRRELVRRSHEEGAKEAARLFRRVLAGQSLEEIEEEEAGAEVIEVIDELTETSDKPETSTDEFGFENESGPAAEPTLEMDAVSEDSKDATADEEIAQKKKPRRKKSKSKSKSKSKAKPKAGKKKSGKKKSGKKSESSKKKKKSKGKKRAPRKPKGTDKE